MELVEGLADRGSYSVHYWVGGKAGAPLVVFTHGVTIDHHEWDATLPFVGERYRVLAWDVPGHGLSRPKDFDIQEAVAAQLAILDQLRLIRVISSGIRWVAILIRSLFFAIHNVSKLWLSLVVRGISRN
jgi:pimeloyl-ACP methyl ester carboxylesterase